MINCTQLVCDHCLKRASQGRKQKNRSIKNREFYIECRFVHSFWIYQNCICHSWSVIALKISKLEKKQKNSTEIKNWVHIHTCTHNENEVVSVQRKKRSGIVTFFCLIHKEHRRRKATLNRQIFIVAKFFFVVVRAWLLLLYRYFFLYALNLLLCLWFYVFRLSTKPTKCRHSSTYI